MGRRDRAVKARKRSRRKRQRREAMRRALAHHGNVMRKLERLLKAMREWDSGVSDALTLARENGVGLGELNAAMREVRA